jgi:hypothetical protein
MHQESYALATGRTILARLITSLLPRMAIEHIATMKRTETMISAGVSHFDASGPRATLRRRWRPLPNQSLVRQTKFRPRSLNEAAPHGIHGSVCEKNSASSDIDLPGPHWAKASDCSQYKGCRPRPFPRLESSVPRSPDGWPDSGTRLCSIQLLRIRTSKNISPVTTESRPSPVKSGAPNLTALV